MSAPVRDTSRGSNGAVHWRPGRLWSVADMLRFYADQFIRSLNWFQTIEMTFAAMPQSQVATDGVVQMFCTDLDELNGHLEKMECRISIKMAIRLQEMMKVNKRFDLNIQQALKELRTRIVDELDDRVLFSINPDNEKLLDDSKPLFGAEVAAKFSSSAEDISESGQCLALNRPTACVFHLMRVMETGVQVFGDKLGVPLASEKNWQNILDEINKAIKALDQKAAQTKAFAGVSSNLYNVKLAWRNEVMHPKQTYTPDEAKKVFSAVESFMCDLASIT